jgi:monoterpene epsilon-lactone hydrolase
MPAVSVPIASSRLRRFPTATSSIFMEAPLPAAAVVLSPWTYLALTGASITLNAKFDATVNAEDVPKFAADYLAGADPRHPYASPLYGDPTGLPPTLIQVSSEEILRDDAVRMAEMM